MEKTEKIDEPHCWECLKIDYKHTIYCSNPNCECHKTKEETAVGKVRHFYLNRLIDESGMSGLGKVAEGIVLPNGTAVMWWLVNACSVQVYQSIDDLHFIHKHGEKNTTQLVFEDKPIKTKEEGVKEKCNLGCKNRELCELLHTKPSQTKEHEHETFEEAKGYIANGKRRAFCKCGEELFNPPQDKLENWKPCGPCCCYKKTCGHDFHACCDCDVNQPKLDKENWEEEWSGWKIVSDMLDKPDSNGIYPTSECYQKLYNFVISQKLKAKQETKEAIRKEVEGMKKDEAWGWDKYFEGEQCCPGDDLADIYNSALEDLLAKLQ